MEVNQELLKLDLAPDRERVIEEIKKSYDLATLCCIPFIEGNFHRISQISRKIGISTEKFERHSKLLLESQIWQVSGSQIIPNFDPLDLGDISVPEYLGMTIHIISRISNERPSSFETMTLATTRDLISEFHKKVNKALNELYEKSQDLNERQCLFSWTHAGLIEFEKQIKIKTKEEQI